MKKLIPYLVAGIVCILAVIPPLELSINFTNSPMRFVWTFLICGLMAFYFAFTKANIWLKILLPYLFLNTFLSRIPHLSMSSFIWVVASAYFYLLCLEIKDWQPIFRALLCVGILELLLLALRATYKDTLLNFGNTLECFGTVGNPMQIKTLLIILAAFLLQDIKPRKRYIYLTYAVVGSMALAYILNPQVWSFFVYARGAVWIKTLKMWIQHPIIGCGIGTFQVIFPALARGKFELEGVWQSPHNAPIEFLFEIGMIGFLILLAYGISISRHSKGFLILGNMLVLFTLCVHFPIIQNSTTLPLVLYLAYCEVTNGRIRTQ